MLSVNSNSAVSYFRALQHSAHCIFSIWAYMIPVRSLCFFFKPRSCMKKPQFRERIWSFPTWVPEPRGTSQFLRSPWPRPSYPLTSWRSIWWSPWLGDCSRSGFLPRLTWPILLSGIRLTRIIRKSTACRKQSVSLVAMPWALEKWFWGQK